MTVEGVDLYNLNLTGKVACSVTTKNASGQTGPKVIIKRSQRLTINSFIVLDHHPMDSRTDIAKDQNAIQTLARNMGAGGGNVPLIMEKKNDLCAGKQSKSRDHTG